MQIFCFPPLLFITFVLQQTRDRPVLSPLQLITSIPHANILCYNPCWLYADSKLAVTDSLGSVNALETTAVRLATGEACSASPNLALDSVGSRLQGRYRNTGL